MLLCFAQTGLAASYRGIYVVSNPYDTTNATTLTLSDLAAAAATNCNGATSTPGEFCGLTPVQGVPSNAGAITSGIFFTIPWCAWEIDKAPAAACLYRTTNTGIESGQSGGPPPIIGMTSPCATTYDDCQSSGRVNNTPIDCTSRGTPPPPRAS